MQRAPVMKGSGLKPIEEIQPSGEVAHVFGKNLEERVVTKDEDEDEEGESKPESSSGVEVKEQQPKKDEDDIDSIKKRKFDAITGEEEEESVFQGDFKLFVWDLSTSNWVERGRGQLKLNDYKNPDSIKSRLIMRVNGTLKIILNVAIRHSSFKVIANTKTSIRFTDSQAVWAASGSNAHQLRELIDARLEDSSEREESEKHNKEKSEEDSKDEDSKEDKSKVDGRSESPDESHLSSKKTKVIE